MTKVDAEYRVTAGCLLPTIKMSDTPKIQEPYTYVTIEPTQAHTATVIWLHGLGDAGKMMKIPATYLLNATTGLEHIKFIFPTAHTLSITASRGARMNAWQDAFSFDYESRREDEQGFVDAARRINDIISKEQQTIPSDRILIGGISQGSATALFTALTSARPLAGIFILAGYVSLRRKIKELATSFGKSLSIFWGHGCDDPRLKIGFSSATARDLASDLGVSFASHAGRLGAPQEVTYAYDDGPSTPAVEETSDDDEPFSDEEISLSDEEPSTTSVVSSFPDASLANALDVGLLRQASVRFVSYEGLGHWMNDAELVDLGIWMRALLPKLEQ